MKCVCHIKHILLAVLTLAATSQVRGQNIDVDICVYGGTAGGVVAAVQAARMGKSVVLIEPTRHVGGMTTSGLSLTDYGHDIHSIGGVALEFYKRIGLKYGFTNPYWSTPIGEHHSKWYFDPSVAEAVLNEMLAEAKVPIYFNQSLDTTTITGQRITQITTTGGLTVRAKMFIDGTYEGDLMRDTGVSFTMGREGTNVYGESIAGFSLKNVSKEGVFVDPYIIPGDPKSGLLPLIQPGDGGIPGHGDSHVQAYGFRLCFTQVATNQIPVDLEKPANYSEARYEVLRRYINALKVKNGHGQVHLTTLLKLVGASPNNKVDVNNNNCVSSDFIGASNTWATNTYAGRAAIYQAHVDYLRGYLFFLATSTNIPANLRDEMRSWGFAKDEFKDNGGWPYQLYVREARRMISDYVLQQSDCEGKRVAADSIGLASYWMDSHNLQRIVYKGSMVREGGMFAPVVNAYPISYRSIIPRVGQCQNLFETFAISASHVGFASFRMEPVHIIVSQSAATAAALAIDDNVPVQQVNYAKLAARLKADKQVLIASKSPAK